MHTMFDFLTHVKSVEYIVSLLFIGAYLLYWEILKPKPFRTLIHELKEDTQYIKETGYRNTLRTIGMVVAAPFIGLAYVIILPFSFVFVLITSVVNGVLSLAGSSASFGWRPTEAYLAGKENKEGETKSEKDEQK